MKKTFLLPAFLAVFSMSCTQEPLPEEEIPAEKTTAEPACRAGMVNVKFSADLAEKIEKDMEGNGIVTKAASPGISDLYREMGIISLERIFPYAGEYEERTRKEGLHRWYRVEYDPSVPLAKASGSLSAVPGVDIVEPVRRIRNTAVFDDPYIGSQWHYFNDGSLGGKHKAGADINVVPVWETYTTGSDKVAVSVVDGGIDYTHEDLAANYDAAGSFNFVDNNSRIVPHDHGTHVAGTIAAVNGNGKGVSGIAGGDAAKGVKGVRLLSCQVFKANPDDPSKDISGDFENAIKWGADHGAVISQNSWGYGFENPEDGKDVNIDSALKEAVDYFIKYAGCDKSGNQLPDSPMKGGVVIFAAGNDGMPWGPPANYEPIIAVGSIASDYTRAWYSNYGDWVDIAAPGGDTSYDKGGVLSTMPGNSYGWMQGTSMACPHVSGVAALLVSYFGGPGFTSEMLRKRLLEGARQDALLPGTQIGPLMDAMGAFSFGGTTPPDRVEHFETSASGNTIFFSWDVTRDEDNEKAYGYILLVSKDKEALENIDNFNSLPDNIITSRVKVGGAKVGDAIRGYVTGLEFSTAYHVAIAGYDYGDNWSGLSDIAETSTGQNNPPEIYIESEGKISIKAHETAEIKVRVSDPDMNPVTVTLSQDSGAAVISPGNGDGLYILKIVGNGAEAGTYTAVVNASDGFGGTASAELSYTLLENHAPEIIRTIEDKIMDIGETFVLDMDDYISDPDGEQLKYTVISSNTRTAQITSDNNIIKGKALAYGNTDVTVVGADARNLSCKFTFRIAVVNPEEPVAVYPNPVNDYMRIRTGDPAPATVTISAANGTIVFETTVDASAVAPAEIDMRGFAPGRYNVTISTAGMEYSVTVVKL